MKNKSIKVIPFPEIENAYIVISCFPDKDHGNGIKSNMSFFYGTEKSGAEWEPNHGPITKITPYYKDYAGGYGSAIEHWFYDYCTGYGDWSQLAVDQEGLSDYFREGNYPAIFRILERWSGQEEKCTSD